jgi:cell division transport system ATP-binding protein
MIVSIKNAQLNYGKQSVLENVDLDIEKGEFIYLIGRTGSGKSSILKLLYGDLPLTSGEANIAEFDLKKIKRKKLPFLRRKVGVVFQDFQLLMDRTVFDNLKFVLKATGWKKNKNIDARILEVLELVGLQKKLHHRPHQLSGGEQQRVTIARALLNNPLIILADEPTGNLDPETSEDIMRLFLDISERGTAVVMATHDFSQMERFHARTLRVENKNLKEVNSLNDFNPLE